MSPSCRIGPSACTPDSWRDTVEGRPAGETVVLSPSGVSVSLVTTSPPANRLSGRSTKSSLSCYLAESWPSNKTNKRVDTQPCTVPTHRCKAIRRTMLS